MLEKARCSSHHLNNNKIKETKLALQRSLLHKVRGGAETQTFSIHVLSLAKHYHEGYGAVDMVLLPKEELNDEEVAAVLSHSHFLKFI